MPSHDPALGTLLSAKHPRRLPSGEEENGASQPMQRNRTIVFFSFTEPDGTGAEPAEAFGKHPTRETEPDGTGGGTGHFLGRSKGNARSPWPGTAF